MERYCSELPPNKMAATLLVERILAFHPRSKFSQKPTKNALKLANSVENRMFFHLKITIRISRKSFFVARQRPTTFCSCVSEFYCPNFLALWAYIYFEKLSRSYHGEWRSHVGQKMWSKYILWLCPMKDISQVLCQHSNIFVSTVFQFEKFFLLG